jgi:hypothetical protein
MRWGLDTGCTGLTTWLYRLYMWLVMRRWVLGCLEEWQVSLYGKKAQDAAVSLAFI